MKKTAFVIRHSKREEISNVKNHLDILLTNEGKEIASEFGKNLKKDFSKIIIFSSPVQRCIETGECIREAFEGNEEIMISNILGEPGPFVFGDAWESFEKLGTVGVVESLEKGIDLPFINSESTGTKKLLDFVRGEVNKFDNETAVVFITHDACIAPVINFFTGEYFSKNHWIEFLGGIRIQFDDNSIFVQRVNGVK